MTPLITSMQGYIPSHMQEGLERYILEGVHGGSFMMAVLENNLKDAVMYADRINKECLPKYVEWLFTYAPSTCWGSRENVLNWRLQHAK